MHFVKDLILAGGELERGNRAQEAIIETKPAVITLQWRTFLWMVGT